MNHRSKNTTDVSSLKVLDIFCGAGGFSEGFRQAGFQILGGVDFDPQAINTYAKNFGESLALVWDLKTPLHECPSAALLMMRGVDVVVGGPPCQGFSIAGKRNAKDPRNRLFEAYFDILKEEKPMAVVVENVPTMLTMGNGAFMDELTSRLEGLGYHVQVRLLTADQYGVPQKRKRVIVVAVDEKRSRARFHFPKGSPNYITCEDAIGDLPLLDDNPGADIQAYQAPPGTTFQRKMRSGSKMLTNHWAVQHTEKTKSIIALVPDGCNYKSLPKELWSSRKVNIAWTRMRSNKPCFTIDAGHNHHFHYKANRVPTVRECARIQSFPDKFIFLGNKTSQYRQVGNAIPPLLAYSIAKSLKVIL